MIELMPRNVADSLERLDLTLDTPHEIPELQKLLYETVLAGGKRFRPALCFLMGEILGVSGAECSPYARVAELMHAATLAHDDVIDEATKRRNRPTLNHIATNQKAVLTGDLLLARVVFEIAQKGNLEILRDGSQVLEDLVRGEWLQIDRRNQSQVNRARLEAAAIKKTASLIAWCCTTPARLAGNDPTMVERCRKFGNLVGLSFQMADDILDFEKDGEKPYANDIREGLVNFVILEMMERDASTQPKIQKLLDDAANNRALNWPWDESTLDSAKLGVREKTRQMLEDARKELAEISQHSPNPRADERQAATEALDMILAMMAERIR